MDRLAEQIKYDVLRTRPVRGLTYSRGLNGKRETGDRLLAG